MRLNESQEIMKNLKEGSESNKYYYIDSANPEVSGFNEVYNSAANSEVLGALSEIARYFNEGSEFINKVMNTSEGIYYQYPPGEAELLKKLANKVSEVEKELNEWYTNED